MRRNIFNLSQEISMHLNAAITQGVSLKQPFDYATLPRSLWRRAHVATVLRARGESQWRDWIDISISTAR